MAKLLDYLNTLDKSAVAREEHNKDAIKAMTDFGLGEEEQAAFLSGDKEKIAQHIGVDVAALPPIQVIIDTY